MKSKVKRFKVIYGAGIMGWLDYPQEYAQACLEFLADPEAYVGTTGHELDSRHEGIPADGAGRGRVTDYNRYPDSKPRRGSAEKARRRMDWTSIYESRRCSLDEAAGHVKSGDRVILGSACGTPKT